MGYYDDKVNYEARGIDYDLDACLEYNPQDGFAVTDIARVLAVWEGENDGDDWRWILLLNDGRYAFLQGGCDYTGWDCQSGADSAIVPTIADALAEAKKAYQHADNQAEVHAALARQLLGQKDQTWHERTGKELGL